jgi:hypothetical protein
MAGKKIIEVTEQNRLNDAREAGIPWKKWGPYPTISDSTIVKTSHF